MNRSSRTFSSHFTFIAAFMALYIVFLSPLLTFKQGFLVGDYGVQFYPWAYTYSQALKQGYLPLWTSLIQCGFPLFAEGQTGMLYLLNVIFFKFLPFHPAYNLMFLSHFLMGGVFTYVFAAKKGMSKEAATVSAIAFTFGSAYAGCFYNIVAMRSLVWFPLELYLVEKYLEKRKLLPLFVLALVQSQSWLAGFPQTAAYACFFIIVYYSLRLYEEKKLITRWIKISIYFSMAILLSVIIALPQLWATFSLANESTRVLQQKEFALWGSVAPWCLTTFFMYSWGIFLRYKVYVGIWPFLIFLISPFERRLKIWWVLAGLSLFFALGAFNPIYWILIHLPMVSLLRNPSKFLFFTAFFLSIVAGFSFDALGRRVRDESTAGSRQILSKSIKFVVTFFVVAIGVWAMVQFGSRVLLKFGKWYVNSFVIGKSFHPGSPAEYLEKIQSVLGTQQKELSLHNPFFWIPFLLALAFLGTLTLVKIKKISWSGFKTTFFIMLVVDLFLFGKSDYGTGFVGNVGPFPDSTRIERLERDGRWLDLTRGEDALLPPNRNMLTDHAQVGAYSPLLDKNYYLLTKGLGSLDDSFGITNFSIDFLRENRQLVNFLGVKYIAAPEGQVLADFSPLYSIGKIKVFLNPEALGEFNLAVEKGFSNVRVLENKPMFAAVETDSSEGGFLVRSQLYSKDWKVTVDGKKGAIERVGSAFQGVELSKGGHRVEWRYQPDWFTIGRWFYAGGLVVVFLGILLFGVLPLKGKVE